MASMERILSLCLEKLNASFLVTVLMLKIKKERSEEMINKMVIFYEDNKKYLSNVF